MKKLLLIIVAILSIVTFANAQASTKLSEGIKYFHYSDTLEKNDAITQYYYIPDFCVNLRIQTDCDTLATGYIKTSTQVYGSVDYSNWVAVGSALVTSGNGASATNTALNSGIYWPYVKITTTAVDSTQYVDFKYRLVIDKN